MASTLYVRASAGRIWGCRGDCCDTQQSPSEFATRIAEGASNLRLEGCSENAELIMALGRVGLDGQRVSLCAPYRGRSPQSDLQQMWYDGQQQQVRRPFFPITSLDYVNFALLQHWQRGEKLAALKLLARHPASVAFAYAEFGAVLKMVELICQLVDPRWFRNPNRLSRWNKLFRYLRLYPQQFNRQRFSPAVLAWFDVNRLDEASQSGNYFYRQWFRCPTICSTEQSSGLERVTRRFIAMVAWSWLDLQRQIRGQRGLFDAQLFFDGPKAEGRYLKLQYDFLGKSGAFDAASYKG